LFSSISVLEITLDVTLLCPVKLLTIQRLNKAKNYYVSTKVFVVKLIAHLILEQWLRIRFSEH